MSAIPAIAAPVLFIISLDFVTRPELDADIDADAPVALVALCPGWSLHADCRKGGAQIAGKHLLGGLGVTIVLGPNLEVPV
jgi:hypothetical protein